MTRTTSALAAALLVTAYSGVARAQLGTSNNPPPQHLFSTPQPAANSDGGTMAQRRAKLAATKRVHGTVRR